MSHTKCSFEYINMQTKVNHCINIESISVSFYLKQGKMKGS